MADELPANLRALQEILDAPGYELVSVSGGREALHAIERREFAVVLLDYGMPDMSGLEIVQALRRRPDDQWPTPIIFLSALDVAPTSLDEGYAAGAIDFVRKPVSSAVLRSKVAVFASLYCARLAAASSEERFHRLVDAVTDYAIFLLDPSGLVATWNRGAEKIKGYGPREIVGKHFSVFYTLEDQAAGKPARVLDTVRRHGRFEEEGTRVRKDGSKFWANVVVTALRDGAGELTGFAKVTRDLTSRRLAEEGERKLAAERIARVASEEERTEAVVARRELERVNRMKDEFLATMSHELRTPLNSIQGWAGILRKDSSDPAKLRRGLEVIERNAKAQTRLIDDLLDVSRIFSGKLALKRARTELLPLVYAAADAVRPASEAKGVQLMVDVDVAIGATIADADRLQQVVWNLLTNAVRFTQRGGRVALVGKRIGSSVVLSVQDSGLGIAKENIDQVFDRFMQVDSSTTRSHGGLGLGLSIARHIVEGHGGTIRADSAGLGLGATFTVELPIPALGALLPGEGVPGEARSPPPSRSEGERARDASLEGVALLAVDDDAESLELVRILLSGAGARVTTAASAPEALELIDAAGPFDVVVSDVGMPKTDGYAFMRLVRARASESDLPAIALTAFARPEDARAARRAGYQDHLAKPVDPRELVETIRSVVDARDREAHAGARRVSGIARSV